MNHKGESVDDDIRFPEVSTALLPSHLRQPPSWAAFMREIDDEWRRYMLEHDSPEQRLAEKSLEPFRLP